MAVSFFGDFDTTETVVIPFNTFDSNDPSASVTATNLANTDVDIHKDGSLTQRSSAAGVAVDIDVDGITGCHWVTIDLSDNTDAGFYANGSQYSVRIEGVTVDAGTINPWIGAFSIGRMLRPTTAGRTLDVTATGAAGIDWGNIENKTTANDLSATDIQLCDTVTTLTGHTVQTGDSFARIGAAGAGLTNINLPNQTMDIIGDITGNLSGSAGSVTGAVGSVTGAVGSVTGHTNQTGDTYALANGAAGFVAIDTVVDAVKVVTDKIVFTVANQVDANTKSINDATVVGDGNATPWDGA